MKSPLRTVSVIILILFALLAGAAGIFVATFDPNDYKSLITREVQKATGRTLVLTGTLELSLFPWIGISTGPLLLGNPAGFGEDAFLRAEDLQLHARLRPLLHKELHIDRVVLSGVSVHLMRNVKGAPNWLFSPAGNALPPAGTDTAPSGASQAAAGAGLAAFSVQSVQVRDASVQYTDMQTGLAAAATGISLTTTAIAPGRTSDISLEGNWLLTSPDMQGTASLTTRLELGETLETVTAADTSLCITASGPSVPSGRATLEAAGDLRFNMPDMTVTANGLRISTMDSTLTGTISADLMRSAVQASIHAESPLRRTLEQLGMPLQLPDDTALALQADINLTAAADRLTVHRLTGRLDKTAFSGNATLVPGVSPDIRFALAADKVNLDMYLPQEQSMKNAEPQQTGKSASGKLASGKADRRQSTMPGTAPAAQSVAPQAGGTDTTGADAASRERLRRLRLDGNVSIGTLQARGLEVTGLTARALAADGVLRIDPLDMAAYGGRVTLSAGADTTAALPVVRGALHVSGLQVEQPVTVLAGRKLLSGILRTRMNVQGKGLQWAALAPSLSGNGSVSLTEGVVHGVQIVPAEASSHLRQESQVKRLDKAARQQRFDSLTGTFDIVSGRVTNNDMKLTSYDLSGTGAGWADLPSGTVNYQARLHVTGLPVIPVSITGPLAAPSYGLDVAGFTGNILKGVGNLLKKPADTGIETLEDVGGLLRQMFGRPASR